MKYKNMISSYFLIILLMVIGSYFIGHYIFKSTNENSSTLEKMNLISDEENFELIGRNEVLDNPWGYNIGFIDTDEYGRVLFLTPNTSIRTTIVNEDYKELSLELGLHPWVNEEETDGVGINVEIYPEGNVNNKILKEIFIDSKQMEKYEIDISEFDNEKLDINISCNNGKGSSNNDWILIYNLVVN